MYLYDTSAIVRFYLSFVCFFVSICRELQESLTIKENGLMEGSRIVLIPNVETGLLVSLLLTFSLYLFSFFSFV